jgi:Ser/Thr protein kinase RdoA (MazF antagonist)
MMSQTKLLSLINKFDIPDVAVSVVPHGQGHIHDTYFVRVLDPASPGYILQRINHHIFRDVQAMMENIEKVTRHIRNKLEAMPGHDPEKESITLFYTKQGKAWYEDKSGNFWRLYLFIRDTQVFQEVNNPELAVEAGRIIGRFQSLLSTLDEPLHETLPNFHDVNFRIGQYEEAISKDPAGRLKDIKPEIELVESRFEDMRNYLYQLKKHAVVHVTHNDTKVNNILFDRTLKAQCLIDLDTVMPGYVHFDFGDALRTLANSATEDEKDLSKVRFNIKLFRAFSKGYLTEAKTFLNPEEIRMLPFSAAYLTFVIGLRFLTDHINGDVYYKTRYPGHNLDRARVQLKLVQEIETALRDLA